MIQDVNFRPWKYEIPRELRLDFQRVCKLANSVFQCPSTDWNALRWQRFSLILLDVELPAGGVVFGHILERWAGKSFVFLPFVVNGDDSATFVT